MTKLSERQPEQGEDPLRELLSSRIYNLAIALRRATNLQAKRRFGLERENWRVLVLLGAAQSVTMGALAERISLDHGQLSREVTALVEKGLVKRRRQWRHVHLSLTRDGDELYRDLISVAHERNETLFEGVSHEHRQLVLDVLDQALIRARLLYDAEKGMDAQGNSNESGNLGIGNEG